MNTTMQRFDYCCMPKPALKERALMTPIQAGGLAAVIGLKIVPYLT
jgi:hypothetical protein